MSREQVVAFCKTVTAETDPQAVIDAAAETDFDHCGIPVGVYMAVGGALPPLAQLARDKRSDGKIGAFLDALKSALLKGKVETTEERKNQLQPLIDWNNRSIEICQEIGREDLIEYFTDQNEKMEAQIK